MTWNIDPLAFQLGPISLHWYGLFFAAGLMAGHRIAMKIAITHRIPLAILDRVFFWMFVGTLVGARLGHCLFYDPAHYLSHPLEIIAIWEGGLASHGAIFGIGGALILLSVKLRKLDARFTPLFLLDWAAPGIAAACTSIRLGNFFNSEIVGRPTDLPWAITFLRVDTLPRHPSQLYESLGYGIMTFVLTHLALRTKALEHRGRLIGIFFVTMLSFRFFIEFLKENQSAFESGWSINMGQWLSIPFFFCGVILLWKSRSPRS